MSELDLSEFHAHAQTSGVLCWYRRIQLTPEQQEKLDAAMADSSIPTAAIARVLASWGHRWSTAAIFNHRRGACRCD